MNQPTLIATIEEARRFYPSSSANTTPSMDDPAFREYCNEYAAFKAAVPYLMQYFDGRTENFISSSPERFTAHFWCAIRGETAKAEHPLFPPGSEEAERFARFARAFVGCGREYWLRMRYLATQKRVWVDILERIIALGTLITLAPLFMAVALLIRVKMGSPVFFIQPRVGKHGAIFKLMKFRTMYTPEEYRRKAGTQAWDGITKGNDDRIPPLGHFLRRYKIDELPQLFNILRGEMEIIGYRPELADMVALREADYAVLCQHKPGLSDPASLAFINESDVLARLEAEGHQDIYASKVLPVKTALSTAYLMRRRERMSDPAIVLITALRSQQGGQGIAPHLPEPPAMPEIPDEWLRRHDLIQPL